MTQITIAISALLALLVLALLGAPLLQDNLRAVEVKRDHSQRLATWGAGGQSDGEVTENEASIESTTSPRDETSPPPGWMAADPCAFLPWLADFPQLAPWPDNCTAHESVDVWAARQAWTAGDVATACTLWRRWDGWGDAWQLLNATVQAAAWDDVATLLACLESWGMETDDVTRNRQLYARMSTAYRSLGDAVGPGDVAAALAAYTAADRWDINQRRQGTSAAARLLAQNGDLDNALAHLQSQAADASLDVNVRYRLWLEAGDLAATRPDRAPTAQDAFDAARQLRPDQIEPYTRLAALYRNSRPQWSIAAVQAAINSPAAADSTNRRTLLRLLGDLQRSQAEWAAAACAYQAALSLAVDNDRNVLQQALTEMEARLGRAAVCD